MAMTESKTVETESAASLEAPSTRLIEVAFPLRQASLDSVHEKNVRHGHISTLHIWPARRPLAACRAALIATLLPDPNDAKKRKELLEKIGGHVVKKIKKKKLPTGRTEEKIVEETEGGILHWGREKKNKATVEWFREEIKRAYGGRAPRVLDPFAGGGAIPLEAMRLGCEVTAVDINPVAWLILKCTLDYPQRLSGQKWPLPEFVLQDRKFMESFFKAEGLKGARLAAALEKIGIGKNPSPHLPETLKEGSLEANLAWHVRAWGWWVQEQARRDLAQFYPAYADFEALIQRKRTKTETTSKSNVQGSNHKRIEVPTLQDGRFDLGALNSEFSEDYLKKTEHPRWVPKPTVAYLWARTVQCKNCRAVIPLLKTRWLSKKDSKRVLLNIEPNSDRTGVAFNVETDVAPAKGSAAQRRESDKRIGEGTMSRSGAWCPCCGRSGTVAMTREDIRQEGLSNRIGVVMTAVVVDGQKGKEYRLPSAREKDISADCLKQLDSVFGEVPFGLPQEPITQDAKQSTWCAQYGFDQFGKLFTSRGLVALATFVRSTRKARDELRKHSYPEVYFEAVQTLISLAVDRLADYISTITHFETKGEFIVDTFQRFALPLSWDFSEVNPLSGRTGSYDSALDWIRLAVDHFLIATDGTTQPSITLNSAMSPEGLNKFDVIVTDPPYYDAISYSALMDFFYVWQRRILQDSGGEFQNAFKEPLGPKWDVNASDGELIDDASRFGGNKDESKLAYENGMYRAFQSCEQSLVEDGKLVVVFAHKHPDAWETLVSAIIRAGFVVDGSWPIQTERTTRTRSLTSAALSSSVWLVCKKRPAVARPGWDSSVLNEMREKIYTRLRDFWDAGIRGPDFVWSATGPALEAYSRHPIVKKANEPGQVLTVPEFLRRVRRIVVDFVVGRVLSHNGNDETSVGLDDVTTYYLLHRHDFGMEDAPIGACILYALSCGLSDSALADQWDLLNRTGGQSTAEADEDDETEDSESEIEEGTGSKVKLKQWNQRKRKSMGYEAPGGRPTPMIDQVHRLMHLWKTGDAAKVDDYLDANGLRRNALFHQLLQALIELAPAATDERALLESVSNHLSTRGVAFEDRQTTYLESEPRLSSDN